MAIVPNALINRSKIDRAIAKATRALKPDVEYIRYTLEEDWTGDPSISFRIVLSDKADVEKKLRAISERVRTTLMNEVRPDELGLQWYFNFRTLSEQIELNESDWR